MRRPDLQANCRRVAIALLSGVLVGAVIEVVEVIILAIIQYSETGIASPFFEFLGVGIIALAIWIIGLASVALLFWLPLHNFGYRSMGVAIALGAITTFGVIFGLTIVSSLSPGFSYSEAGQDLIIDGHMTAVGWRNGFFQAGFMALKGIVVAAVVWRVAYRVEPVVTQSRLDSNEVT